MKNFCKDLREIKNAIIKNVTIENLMLPLKEEENKLRKNKIFVIQSGKKINSDIKLYRKVPDHDHYTVRYRGTAHPTCSLKYKTTNKISVILHNRLNYDYHFIIQEIAEEFERQIECLGG